MIVGPVPSIAIAPAFGFLAAPSLKEGREFALPFNFLLRVGIVLFGLACPLDAILFLAAIVPPPQLRDK